MGTRELACVWLLAGCFGVDGGGGYGGGGGGGGYYPPDARVVDAGPDACIPRTCAAQGASCGMVEDGCGGMLDCGGCAGLATCGGQMVDNVCALPEDERVCADGWCWEAPEPFAFTPRAVFALAPSDVWAVGERGAVMHYDGTGWRAVASNTAADLNDIWMASATDGWLVGAGGVIRRWNGTTWATVASNTTADLRGVWGAAPNDVWIVGDTVTRRWNGSLLLSAALTTPSLQKVFATGNSVFAVGAGFVWELVLSTWTKRTSDSPFLTSYSLTHIAGTATEAYALGRSHDLTSGEDLGFHWNGQSWLRHSDPGDPEWTDVYADGNDIFGVSDQSITNLATTTRVQGPGGVMLAAAGAAGDIFVATRPGLKGQLYQHTGGTWVNGAGFGARRGLLEIARVGDGVWLAGTSGTVIEWRGGVVVHEPPTTRNIAAIAGTARDDVWIADSVGDVYRFDGVQWTNMGAPGLADPKAIVMVGGEVVLVGRKVYRRVNEEWVAETVATDAPSWLVAAEHAGELYIAGTHDGAPDVARIASRANGTWSELPAPAIERICGIAVAAPDDIWVAGHDSVAATNGSVAHWNGTAWSVETFTGAGQLCAIELRDGEVWVSGGNAALHRRSAAGAWTTTQPLAAGSIRALRATADELWAVGDHGAVLRRP